MRSRLDGGRDWQVRRAQPADAEAIADAHADSIRSIGPQYYSPEVVEQWASGLTADLYRHAMTRGEAFFIAIESASERPVVLGFSTHRSTEGHRTAVYVRGSASRRGIGSTLFRLAERDAVESGAHRIDVDASLAAVDFYRAHGFEERGRGEHRLRSGAMMACVFMKKALHDMYLSPLINRSLAGQFSRVRDKIHALVDPLTTEQLWARPYPYGNSIGHLLLHLTGNLNYYIGAQIVGTGYVRDRPREFADTSCRPKPDVLTDFDRAVEMVLAALAAQREEDWAAPFSGVGAEDISNRFAMFLRCAAHADHHAGQIIYLCKQLSLAAPERR